MELYITWCYCVFAFLRYSLKSMLSCNLRLFSWNRATSFFLVTSSVQHFVGPLISVLSRRWIQYQTWGFCANVTFLCSAQVKCPIMFLLMFGMLVLCMCIAHICGTCKYLSSGWATYLQPVSEWKLCMTGFFFARHRDIFFRVMAVCP